MTVYSHAQLPVARFDEDGRTIISSIKRRGEPMAKKKRKRVVQSPGHTFEVKAEIANTTLAKARSALTLQIYRKDLKLGELQIGRGSLFWAGARRQSAKRIHWGRFAEMMDRLAYGRNG
jgi:hypothetical protein